MRHQSAEEATAVMRERYEAGEDALFVDMREGRVVAYDSESESVLRVDHDADYILGSVLRGEDLADVASWGYETPIADELALGSGGLRGGCCDDLDTGGDGWLVDPEPIEIEREFVHGHLARLTDLLGDGEQWRRAALTALEGVPDEYVIAAVEPERVRATSGGMGDQEASEAARDIAARLRADRDRGMLKDLDDALDAEVEGLLHRGGAPDGNVRQGPSPSEEARRDAGGPRLVLRTEAPSRTAYEGGHDRRGPGGPTGQDAGGLRRGLLPEGVEEALEAGVREFYSPSEGRVLLLDRDAAIGRVTVDEALSLALASDSGDDFYWDGFLAGGWTADAESCQGMLSRGDWVPMTARAIGRLWAREHGFADLHTNHGVMPSDASKAKGEDRQAGRGPHRGR